MTCTCGHPQDSHEALFGSCQECICAGYTCEEEGMEDSYPAMPHGAPSDTMTLKQLLSTSVDVAIGTMFLAAFAGAGLFSIPISVIVGSITFIVLVGYQDN